ncbi:nucleolar transcription factor 1-like [Argopecten irradians]|uniref:nucleolar transcription factor 1-like n=1 Tax=Argopecten irradians TaxID=31199 RepID=UPI003719D08E
MESKKAKKKSKKKHKEKDEKSSNDLPATPPAPVSNDHNSTGAWSQEDVTKLLDNIEENYPEKAAGREVSYRRSMPRIKWERVVVEPYTPEDCKVKFTEILTKVKSIRSLSEMVKAARAVKVVDVPYVGVKPKPPTTVYMMFCNQYREKHKGETIVISDLSAKYRNLSEKKKKKLEKMYEKEKLQYKEEMAKFMEQNPDIYSPKKPKTTTTKVKDPKKEVVKCPKVITPVSLYVADLLEEEMAKNPKADKIEIRNRLKAAFAALKDDKQQKWLDQAVLANKDLKARLKAYAEKYPHRKTHTLTMLKHARSISDKALGKPENPRSAFKIFTQKNITKLAHLPYRLQQKKNTGTVEILAAL